MYSKKIKTMIYFSGFIALKDDFGMENSSKFV